MMRGYGGNYGYGFGNSMMNGAGGWLGLVLMLVFGAIVVAGIVALVMWSRSSHAGQGHAAGGAMPAAGAAGHDEAVAIAKRRLAGGEIDHEQYEAIMRSLNG